jgi:hypothetical protein
MVETVGLRALDSTQPLLDKLEALGVSFGGIQHWGMFNDLQAAKIDAAYPRLDTWLQVRQELTSGGKLNTFNNPFSVRSGLTAVPNPPRVGFANGTSTPDPYGFGTVDLHTQRTETFHFPNIGGRTLRVLGSTADGDFRTRDMLLGASRNLELETVAPTAGNGYEIEVKATFFAETAGAHAGTLTIRTNAYEPAGGVIRFPITALVAALDLRLVNPAPGFPLDLGSIDVGSSSAASLMMHNAGTMAATLAAYSFSSAEAADQIEIRTGPLAAGQTYPLAVTYAPTITGLLTTDVTLHFTDGLIPPRYQQDLTLAVTATGIGARAELTPTALELGTVIVGAESVPISLLLRNVGQATLTIASWPRLAELRFLAPPPASVAPGETAQLSVAFRPGHDGDFTSSFTLLSSNSTPPPPPVSMHGVGVIQSLLTARPDTLAFGAAKVPVGSQSEAQSVVVRNQGGTVVRLGGASIVGPGSSAFRIVSTTAGAVLQREETFEVRVVFAPSSVDGMEAVLEVVHDGPTSPLQVLMMGRGSRARGLVPDAIDLDFGRVAVGQSTDQRVTLTNADSEPANIKNVAIAGAEAADFTITMDGCSGSVLAPQGQCVIVLKAGPSAGGPRVASLEVNADLSASPVSLHVEGVAATATWSASIIDFGSMIIGVQAERQGAYLRNVGNAPIVVSQIELAGDFTFQDLSPAYMTLGPNQEKMFWLWFKPTAAGLRQSFLRVYSDANGSPHALELTGLAFEAKPKTPSVVKRPRPRPWTPRGPI